MRRRGWRWRTVPAHCHVACLHCSRAACSAAQAGRWRCSALSIGVDGHGTTRGARCCGCPAPMVALGARALSRSLPLAALALTAVPAEPGGDGGGLRDASGCRVGRGGLSPGRLDAATSSGPGAVGRTDVLALPFSASVSRSSVRFSWVDVACVSSSEGWLDWLLPCDTGCTRLGSAKTLLAGGGRPGGRPRVAWTGIASAKERGSHKGSTSGACSGAGVVLGKDPARSYPLTILIRWARGAHRALTIGLGG